MTTGNAATCWCCGRERDEHELVRLGARPEVEICLDCTVALRQRARERADELRPSVLTSARAAVRRARDLVIARGWHELPVIGQLLRRLNRHLP